MVHLVSVVCYVSLRVIFMGADGNFYVLLQVLPFPFSFAYDDLHVYIIFQTRLQAQAAGVHYSHPLSNLTSRMAYFGPHMVCVWFLLPVLSTSFSLNLSANVSIPVFTS